MTIPRVPGSELLTDLYELTMLQSYFDCSRNGIAVFDLFVRRLPEARNYLVACGIETILDWLEGLRFEEDSIRYLRSLGTFSDPFLHSLTSFRFEGNVDAVLEGTPVFAGEPILQVTAPLPQAQLIETFLINQIQLQTMAASKASRVVRAAQGRRVVDFGLRRAHGSDAGVMAARAFYIAGIDSTSNLLAGKTFGIPVAGTMAHSFVQSSADESSAFREFTQTFPETTLLVDTYDTLAGIRNVIGMANEQKAAFRVRGVRLDSGDLGRLAVESRRLLDEAGLQSVQIFASNTLDEHVIDELLRNGTPLDGFGVGTRMAVSADAPYLELVYKLVEYEGRPTMKRSVEKATLPGRKQIRRIDSDGCDVRDVLSLAGENAPGRPLLQPVMCGGRRRQAARSLEDIRAYSREQVNRLPDDVLDFRRPASYPVELSAGIIRLRQTLERD